MRGYSEASGRILMGKWEDTGRILKWEDTPEAMASGRILGGKWEDFEKIRKGRQKIEK